MKYLILIITLFFFAGCNINKKVAKPEPHFSNGIEQERYWVKQLFEKEYKYLEYPKFDGEIKINDTEIYFGENQFIKYSNIEPEYRLIFEKGLLHPTIIPMSVIIVDREGRNVNKKTGQSYSPISILIRRLDDVSICCIEKLTFLSDNPKVKRFRFFLRDLSMNPQVYFFELTNETADAETDWETFIENAKLTFIKQAWIII